MSWAAQSLAERMVGDEHLELADEPLVMGERELHLDSLFEEGDAALPANERCEAARTPRT